MNNLSKMVKSENQTLFILEMIILLKNLFGEFGNIKFICEGCYLRLC